MPILKIDDRLIGDHQQNPIWQDVEIEYDSNYEMWDRDVEDWVARPCKVKFKLTEHLIYLTVIGLDGTVLDEFDWDIPEFLSNYM